MAVVGVRRGAVVLLVSGSLVSGLVLTPVVAGAVGLKPFVALTAPDPLDAGESSYTVPQPPPFVPRSARTPDPVDVEITTEEGRASEVEGLPVSVEVVDAPADASVAGRDATVPSPTTVAPSTTVAASTTSTTSTPADAAPSTTAVTAADGEIGLQVESLTAADTEDLGGEVLAFGLNLATGETVEGPVSVEVQVDVTDFKYALGADWASRLQLVEWDCSADQAQAQAEACGNPTPVEGSEYDEATGVLTATVVINDTDIVGGGGQTPRLAFSSGSTLGLTSAAGSFSATSLSNSGSWQVGGNNGSFSYSYPIVTPPAFNGVGPSVSLNYDSAAVDGITSAVNSQASEVGLGWNLSAGQGFIERRYLPCTDTRIGGGTSDSCWYVQNATISLNGHASELVPIDGITGQPWTFTKFRLKDDPDWIVERWNGGWPNWWVGENWIVRTPDGMVYSFGSDPTNRSSVLKRPLRGIKTSNDPCWGEPDRLCKDTNAMPYRWMLDKVVDPFGNQMIYNYELQKNRARTLGNGYKATEYDMGALLTSILYGRSPQPGIGIGYRDKVEFSYVRRCGQALFDANDNLCLPITNANGEWYPDVPTDLLCTATDCFKDVSFFQTKRLAFITTSTSANGTTWTQANQWRLYHSFPNPGDGGNEKLWLSSINRIVPGATAPIAPATTMPAPTPLLPPVVFDGTALQNRDDALPSAGVPYMKQFRVTSLSDELGQKITINYTVPSCATSNWASNTSNCYPMYAGFPGGGAGWGRYRKWTVSSIVVRDMVTGPGSGTGNAVTPDVTYTYAYTGAAWHHDGTDWWQDTPGVDDVSWSEWRGFRTVTTTVGSGTTTVSKQVFYQGMHGDNNGAGGARNIPMIKGWTATSDPVGTVTDDDWLAGTVFETYQMDGTTSFLSASRTYGALFSSTSGSQVATGVPVAQYRKWRVSHTVSRLRDGTSAAPAWRDGLVTNYYDTVGRVASVSNEGFLDTSGDESCQQTQYLDQVTSTNPAIATFPLWSQLPAQVVQRAKVCTVSPSLNRPTSVSKFFYGGNSHVASATSTVALDARSQTVDASFKPTVTTSMTRLNNPAGADDLLTDWVITKSGYDAAGRVTSTTDANGKTTTFGFNSTYGYPTTATYPATTVTLSTSTVLRPFDGQPVNTVDQNGLRTDYCYDPLGRTTAVFAPTMDGVARTTLPPAHDLCADYAAAVAAAGSGQPDFTEVPNATFQYNVTEYDYSGWTRLSKPPARVVSSILQDGTNTNDDIRLESTAYIDGHGRTHETQTASPVTGKIIVTAGYTDSRALSALTVDSFAIADPQAGDTISPPGNGLKGFATWPSLPTAVALRTTSVAYDNNSRPITTTINLPPRPASTGVPAAPASTVTTTTSYFGTTTITTPPAGAITASKVDGLGRTVEVHTFSSADGITAPTAQGTAIPGAITTYAYSYDQSAGATGGRMTTTIIDDNQNLTTSTSNLAGRTLVSNDPNAGTSTFAYDPNGNIIRTVDAAGNTINTTYDALNRPIRRWSGTDPWPADPPNPNDAAGLAALAPRLASWTYDGAGGASGFGKGMAWTETSWQDSKPYTTEITDYSGRYLPEETKITIKASTVVPAALDGTWTYQSTYNEGGQPVEQTFPTTPDGPTAAPEIVTTGYDGFGHAVTLTGYVQATSFDDLGRITSRTLSTGASGETALRREYGYDPKTGAINELKARWETSPTPAAWFQDDVYNRDVVGNVTSIGDYGREPTGASDTKECFGYDKWNRLVRAHTTSLAGTCVTNTTTTVTDRGNASTAPYDSAWTFDDINRMQTAVNKVSGVTSDYLYGPVAAQNKNHRITSVDTGTTVNTYSYADNTSPTASLGVGAIVGRGTNPAVLDALAYDTQQRLTTYTKPAGVVEQYRYTTSNQRLIRASADGVTLYLPGMELTADTAGAVTYTSYRSIGATQVATKTVAAGVPTVRWNCASMQNTTTCQVQAALSGAISTPKRQRYTPYGETRGTGELTNTDHRFLGQPQDTTSGLTYLNNRYYDPGVGAFTSVDPLVGKTGTPYLYGDGNPATLSDPSGLAACEDDGSCGSSGYGANPCSRDFGLLSCARNSSGGFNTRWSKKGKEAVANALDGDLTSTPASLGSTTTTRIGDLSGAEKSAAYSAWVHFQSRTNPEFKEQNIGLGDYGDPDLFIVQNLPIYDILVGAGPDAMREAGDALRFADSLPASGPLPREEEPRPYDRYCGCGVMVPDHGLDSVLGFFSAPTSSSEIVPFLLLNGATAWLPVSASVGSLALGFMFDALLINGQRTINPDAPAYPENYWVDTAGIPNWPPYAPT